ncbi:hypothetical protein C8Q70DRAFT_178388 [Cubamyces menziesii]|uniref:Ubiquitin 3 binding protein But2 C-terminal domain-containing protein n=1 Tax=Trametes cubensis TaxID=1111947 RepID=A0AAD7TYJ2_9APHY|nr:hypothetical protein C8Q70DRAFT_178388 [Cubamyces menziesii]KAJ8489279.1 hypothetical protein ONZ51_g3030 [Trametes cubensis]
MSLNVSYIPLLRDDPVHGDDSDSLEEDLQSTHLVKCRDSLAVVDVCLEGRYERRPGRWIYVACIVAIISSLSSLSLVLSTVFTQHVGAIVDRTSPAELQYASTYMGFERVYRNPKATPPPPIRNFPFAIGVVNKSEPTSVYPDNPRWRSTFGTVYHETRRILVTPTHTTYVQFWAGDYGMERCSLQMTLPTVDDEDIDLVENDNTASVQIWRTNTTRRLSLDELSWNTRPHRGEFIASFDLRRNATARSPEFLCRSGSFHTFELGCEEISCFVDFKQTPKQKKIGIWLVQENSL